MNEEKKYFSSLVEIEIALLITSAVFSFFIEVILHTSIVNCREGLISFTETNNIYFLISSGDKIKLSTNAL